ncbi:MAG: hypothetical protein V4793_36520, partial [Paraburkholderia tropica]
AESYVSPYMQSAHMQLAHISGERQAQTKAVAQAANDSRRTNFAHLVLMYDNFVVWSRSQILKR